MDIIENIIDKYYIYSETILLMFCLIFSVIIRIVSFFDWGSNTKYYINRLIYKVIYSVLSVCIGILLCSMGLSLEVKSGYFNVLFFVVIVGGAIIYGILLLFMFKQTALLTLQICRFIQFVTYLEIFLLSVKQHLEWWEWVTGTLEVVCIEIFIMRFEKNAEKQEKNLRKETDYSDSNLYPARRKQLERFAEILEEQKYEPYAIMISGEWGIGKSSFVKALEEKLADDSFIWICAGSEKTVSEILSEISSKIVGVLRKSNIFVGHSGLIEQYFLAFSDLIENTALGPLKKIANILFGSQKTDEREYLNEKLDAMENTIYLIVDDLDRCDDEYQEKMFKVIRESMELHNCKTIFLVDKTKFLAQKFKDNQLEKYVSYTLDLCEVGYTDIVGWFMDDILDDKFFEEMNPTLSKGRNKEQIKDMIYDILDSMLEIFDGAISSQEKYEDENNRDIIVEIENRQLEIKKNTSISRKVKNYLKGIKRDVETLNGSLEEEKEDFLKEEWLKNIIKVQFVKNFLSEIYNDIKAQRNLSDYRTSRLSYLIGMIFSIGPKGIFYDEKKYLVLNYIIYNIDIQDFSKVKTLKKRWLNELNGEKATISHINDYVEAAQSYDDLRKILRIYETQDIGDPNKIYRKDYLYDGTFRICFIDKIFEVLSEIYGTFKVSA